MQSEDACGDKWRSNEWSVPLVIDVNLVHPYHILSYYPSVLRWTILGKVPVRWRVEESQSLRGNLCLLGVSLSPSISMKLSLNYLLIYTLFCNIILMRSLPSRDDQILKRWKNWKTHSTPVTSLNQFSKMAAILPEDGLLKNHKEFLASFSGQLCYLWDEILRFWDAWFFAEVNLVKAYDLHYQEMHESLNSNVH